MTFGVFPVMPAAFPPVAGTEATRNIQFQHNGQDVGRRNTDTVNVRSTILSAFAATIGVGESVNKLTLGQNSAAPPPPEPTTLWLDLFDGPAEQELTDHPQDTPLNGSVWLNPDSNMWQLTGSGGALAPEGSIGVFTSFGNTAVLPGWVMEFDYMMPPEVPSGRYQMLLSTLLGSLVGIEFIAGDGSRIYVAGAEVTVSRSEFLVGTHTMRFELGTNVGRVFMDNVQVYEFGGDDGYVFPDTLDNFVAWCVAYNADAQMRMDRVRIYGALAT